MLLQSNERIPTEIIYIFFFLNLLYIWVACFFLSSKPWSGDLKKSKCVKSCPVVLDTDYHLPLWKAKLSVFCYFATSVALNSQMQESKCKNYFFLLKGDNIFILGKGGMFGAEGCPRESLTVRLGTHHNGRSCPTVYLHTIQALMLLERYCSESLSHGRSWPWGKKKIVKCLIVLIRILYFKCKFLGQNVLFKSSLLWIKWYKFNACWQFWREQTFFIQSYRLLATAILSSSEKYFVLVSYRVSSFSGWVVCFGQVTVKRNSNVKS